MLAARIVGALRDAGLDATLDASHGLDHGAWVPLRRIFPAADRPIVTLSIDPRADAAAHAALGRALSFLPGEGVLVVGSGGFTHNLGALRWDDPRAPASPQSAAFADWLGERLQARDCAAVLDWAGRAPHARDNHPTPEHLLPLFVAWGAAGPAPRAERWHVDVEYGALRIGRLRLPPGRPRVTPGSAQQALDDPAVDATQPREILDAHVLVELVDGGVDRAELDHLAPSGAMKRPSRGAAAGVELTASVRSAPRCRATALVEQSRRGGEGRAVTAASDRGNRAVARAARLRAPAAVCGVRTRC